MAIKLKDLAAEKEAHLKRVKEIDLEATHQLGTIVELAGGNELSLQALAGAVMAAVEQGKKQPEAIARWAERGQALFQQGGARRGKKNGAGHAAQAAQADPGETAPSHRKGT